jgi:hypothetical protein
MGMLSDSMKKGVEKKEKKAFGSPEEFWDAWINADELQKNALIQGLNMFRMIQDPMMRRAFVNLVNSYLVDLHSYMSEKIRYMSAEKVPAVSEEARYGTGNTEGVSQVQP